MAYVDKSCDMKRVCIAQGGHIQFEGVEFDDYDMILRGRGVLCDLQTTLDITKEYLLKKIDIFNNNLLRNEEPLKLLYQDKDNCNWDVKTDYVLSEKDLNCEMEE